ncbi:MAG: hypothetical protein ABSF72_19035 [Candidatus Sulfotelmatobacter sp.]
MFRAQPVPGAEAQLFHALDPADPRRKFWTQQARIGGFVAQTAHRCQLLVDRVGRQPA